MDDAHYSSAPLIAELTQARAALEAERARREKVEAAARVVCDNSSRPLGYTDVVVLVPRAALEKLRRVLEGQE